MGDSEATTRQCYKEGFLVKKGHVRTNWRTRWFVVGKTSLSYYKKKEDSMAIGNIALQGCSVISPCPEYNKKPGVFRIVTRGGKEFLVQAASEVERDEWVQAIGDAIRRSDTKGDRVSSVQPQLNVSHSELVGAMQDGDAGVPLEKISQDGKELKNCFRGEKLVDWLISWSFVSNPEEAISLGQSLLQQGHVQSMSKENLADFDAGKIYRFSTLQLESAGKKPFDSSDDESDEERPLNGSKIDTLTKESKGKVLKQGFLIKRGHVRHTWKTRLFVMKKDPPGAKLFYYKGSKQEEKPLGEVPLARCRVELVFSGTGDSDVKNKSRTNLFKIITHKRDEYILQAHTEEERDEWMKAIQSPTTYFTK